MTATATPPATDDVLITRKQAAKLLAVHENSLVNLEQRGVFKPVRLGRSVRYFKSDVVATLRALRDEQTLVN